MAHVRTTYLGSIFNQNCFPRMVRKLVAKIKKSGVQFDTIVFRGSSGSMVAPLVALKLKKELTHIRKRDNNHYHCELEGYVGASNFIIVDDLICSGETINEMFRVVRSVENNLWSDDAPPIKTAKCVGIFLYHSSKEDGEHKVRFKRNNSEKWEEEFVPMFSFRID